MADTTQEILTLENDTPVRLRGRVKVVFNMSQGESQHGPWYRQDFILADGEGEVKVGWFDPGPTEKMTSLSGREVEVQGKVNHYTNTKVNPPERMTSVKAAGSEAVRSLSQPPPAPSPANPTHTPDGAGSAPQGAEKPVHGQADALPLAEYQRWWLGRWEWYENSPPIQRAIQRGEPVAGVIRDAVGAEWMSQSPYERNIERSPYRGEGGGQTQVDPPAWPDDPGYIPLDDDDDIPF
jgi:hypothetical protein